MQSRGANLYMVYAGGRSRDMESRHHRCTIDPQSLFSANVLSSNPGVQEPRSPGVQEVRGSRGSSYPGVQGVQGVQELNPEAPEGIQYPEFHGVCPKDKVGYPEIQEIQDPNWPKLEEHPDIRSFKHQNLSLFI
jgi:hypothetical protein